MTEKDMCDLHDTLAKHFSITRDDASLHGVRVTLLEWKLNSSTWQRLQMLRGKARSSATTGQINGDTEAMLDGFRKARA